MPNNYTNLCRNLLDNLRDRKVLNTNVEYMPNKGLIQRTSTNAGSYTVIYHGTVKECYSFLAGIDFISQS